jgi:[glutamine synthetase] adenylyltransferase / [glutamine synthetase]-adenylyl-L-tyrosine phosphorylase
LAAGVKAAKLSHSDQTALLDAYRFCWRLQSASKLLSDRVLDASAVGSGGQKFLLREVAETEAEALSLKLTKLTALAEAVILTHLEA